MEFSAQKQELFKFSHPDDINTIVVVYSDNTYKASHWREGQYMYYKIIDNQVLCSHDGDEESFFYDKDFSDLFLLALGTYITETIILHKDEK